MRWNMINIFIAIAFLFLGTVASDAETVSNNLLFSDDFSNTEITGRKWEFNKNWMIADSQLTSKLGKGLTCSLELKDSNNLLYYSLEFDLKRNNVASDDNHCGIKIADNNYIIIRERSIRYVSPGLKSEQGISYQNEQFMRGEWYHFNIVCDKREIKVIVDGRYLLTIKREHPKASPIVLSAWQMSASFKDFKLYNYSEDNSGIANVKSPTKNIIPNSGFEFVSQEKLPDYWGTPGWGLNNMKWFTNFEKWRSLWGVTNEGAYDGKYALRLSYPDKDQYPGDIRCCELNIEPGKRYTLSAYFKGQPGGMEVLFAGTKIVLTDKWQRYSIPFTCKGKDLYDRMFSIKALTCGTMWIDNAQLEEGVTASEYSQSETDLYLAKGQSAISDVPLPSIKAVQLDGKPVIDGKLDELCWQKSICLPLILLNGKVPKEETRAFLWYDNNGFYIGFECQEKDIATKKCKAKKENTNVWMDPCVEVFISPESDLDNYRHFALNSDAVKYSTTNSDMSWTGYWNVKTYKEKDFWSAEIFIPFGNFQLKKLSSGKWRINLCRDNNEIQEFSTWSPLSGNFHKPEMFAFVDLSEVFLPQLTDLDSLEFKNTGDSLSAAFNVTSTTDKDMPVIANLEIYYKDGTSKRLEKKILIEKHKTQKIILEGLSPEKISDARKCILTLFDSTGNVQAQLRENNFKIRPVLDAVLQYSYYMKEENACLKLILGREFNTSSVLRIAVDGKTISEQNAAGIKDQEYIQIPIVELATGTHNIDIQLVDQKDGQDQKLVAQTRIQLDKKEFKKNAVQIDHFRRCLSVDGKPDLPISIYCADKMISRELMDNMKAAGFKTLFLQVYDGRDMDEYLEYADKLGLKIIWEMRTYSFNTFDQKSWEAYQKKSIDIVNRYKDYPAILAWNIMDERAGLSIMNENPAAFSAFFSYPQIIKKADPYHPVYTNEYDKGLVALIDRMQGWPSDIVSVDYYPMDKSRDRTAVCPFMLKHKNIAYTSEVVRMENIISEIGNKPVFFFVQSSGYSYFASKEPFPAEVEFMTYTALINGARGIVYFGEHPRSAAVWNKLKDMNREILYLAPVVFSQSDVGGTIGKSSDKIQVLIRNYENCTYLITLNSSDKALDAKLDLSKLVPGKADNVEVLFENRNLKIMDGNLSDRFEGYQRHVYKIQLVQ